MILWWLMSWESENYRVFVIKYVKFLLFQLFQKMIWLFCTQWDFLTCVFPDGRDHTLCCKESLVPSACDNICQFSQHDELTADFITCVSYTGIIANCYREGLGNFLLIRYLIALLCYLFGLDGTLQWSFFT